MTAPLDLRGETAAGRHRRAELTFALGGGRSALVRQVTPYPFHVTKPFALDRARPDLATLYLQSASGGVYRADRLDLSLTVKAGAAAHVTSQAATVVHDTGALPARQSLTIDVHADAFAAVTLDPLVLFPGAELTTTTHIRLGEGALALVADGVAWHDFSGAGRPFGRLTAETLVSGPAGGVLLRDRSTVRGAELCGERSLLGPGAGAYGAALLLGPMEAMPRPEALDAALDALGVRSGASPLPNGAGLGLRMIAANGGRITLAVEAVFALAVEAMLGFAPARRRK
ncbi:urease accessory protein UreD [Methylopila musalis]|uniref:Urease accessory protein UreD n=1 Tax=Methylopila musalis TaxID=1134781 RepID=A0ABW3ZAC8_9HYPH